MKKTQIILAALVIFAVAAFAVNDSSERVLIYHKGSIIEVAPQAVPAHLRHGDTLVGGGSSGSQSLGW